jgi:hypothetical protein
MRAIPVLHALLSPTGRWQGEIFASLTENPDVDRFSGEQMTYLENGAKGMYGGCFVRVHFLVLNWL